jgi:hypothetical protein
VCLDGYMNVAMEQTEEFVDGQLRNKFGDAFIRGNNGEGWGGGGGVGWEGRRRPVRASCLV